MSTISASTTSTTAFKITTDTTGALVFQTGASPTTAMTLGSDQSVTFAGAVTLSGNQTVTGNLTVNGNTTIGDASTDTATVNATTTFAQAANLPNTFGFKNRIINGAMMIDQRNAGASVTTSVLQSNTYFLDRWAYYNDVVSKRTLQQSSTAPAGFINSMLVTVIATDTVGPQQYIRQAIEGLNLADFGWGTASAKNATLSFWVRSSVTGQMGGAIQNNATNRSYPFAYTINSANTWEYKTVLITGDTTGTWLTTNGIGASLLFENGPGYQKSTAGTWVAQNTTSSTGSVNLCATNGATWYITGVQFEIGSTATSFDFRSYGTELALCQRYFCTNFNVGVAPSQGGSNDNRPCIGTVFNSTDLQGSEIAFPVAMRSTPSITFYRPSFIATDGNWGVYPMHWGGGGFPVAIVNCNVYRLIAGGPVTGGTNYNSYIMSGYFTASSEL